MVGRMQFMWALSLGAFVAVLVLAVALSIMATRSVSWPRAKATR